jgi:integrase
VPKLLLNDRFVLHARADKRTKYSDTQERGLVLRVDRETKSWYFVYRHGGPVEWYRLGAYPAISLKDARELVRDHRYQLDKLGVDPAVARRTPPAKPEPTPEPPKAYTFGDFVPTFIAFQKGRNKDWKNDEQKIARHILPAWSSLPLDEITRRHVQELLDGIAAKGLTVGVNRVQALVSRIFTVALDRGLIDAHPAARIIKRFTETPRDRVLTDAEIRALWIGLDARPGPASDAIRLRLLLGQRGQETAGMHWAEVDLDAAEWTLPRPRTKSRQRAHCVPLPSTAHALLTKRRELVGADEPRVFPDLSLLDDDHKDLAVLHGGRYTWADLRRTVGTRLGSLGYDDPLIGRVLKHARYSVTARHYNHAEYVGPIREALTAWDVELHRILRGEPSARVVSFRSRKKN